MILQKYIPALNSLAIVVLSALIAIPSGQLNWTSATQLVAITLSGIGLYVMPLLNISWQGALKTGIAIVGAIVTAAFPLFQTVVDGQPFKPIYLALIVLAAAHALGTQVGVDIRTDTAAVIATGPSLPAESTVDQTEEPEPVTLSEFDRTIIPDTSTNTVALSAVNPANLEDEDSD